ncbi:MAG: hypothetical protein ACRC67_13075 [Inquilinus sp.]|uniref:hypothetical protein n=1 Tax=Inquilinus sp. TaxID=1932117 RepID=UPI003F371DE5
MGDSKAYENKLVGNVEHKEPRVFRAVRLAIRAPKDAGMVAAALRAITEEAAALASGILARVRQKPRRRASTASSFKPANSVLLAQGPLRSNPGGLCLSDQAEAGFLQFKFTV